MRTLLQDLRFGARLLLASPGFTAVAIFTLALGIAANSTVFNWIDNLLLRPYPGATNGHRLAALEMVTRGAPNGANRTSYLDYRDYRQNLRTLAGLAIHHEDVFSLGEGTSGGAVWGELVSGNYFAVLGVTPALGRTFTTEEDQDKLGAYPVAVISHRLWQRRFHGDPAAVGKTLRVNQRELTVVGVASPEFRGTIPGLFYDIWIPLAMSDELGELDAPAFRDRGNRNWYALARLKDGVSIAQARAEAATYSRSLEAANPKTNRGVTATILPVWAVHSGVPDMLLKPLRILMAIAVLVLLIVCANVANLLLARSTARKKELSIRLALGAGGGRLSRQLLTETLLLAVAGTAGGLLLAPWMAEMLPSLVPNVGAPVILGFHMSGRILGFTILACLLATLVSGVAPALFWHHRDANEMLKEGGRSGSQSATSHRLRAVLVVAEVALATLALIGSGLFARSFRNARSINPGFERENVLLMRFYLGGAKFSTPNMQQFCLRLRDRLQRAPGVADVSYADYAPLGTNSGPYSAIQVEGYVPGSEESMNVNRYQVAPGYFSLLRIPILEGRDFLASDDPDAPPVLIVNQSFARRYFHGASPLGRKVRFLRKWNTVVGLVKDTKYFDVAEAPRPHFFAPYRQYAVTGQQLYCFVKTAGDATPVRAGLRAAVADVDRNAGAFDAMGLADWTEITLFPQKVAASLMAALGVIALVLAAVGLYSVMAYAVSQRTQEIGIRMALGARPRDVLGDVLLRGMLLTTMGLTAGIAAALAMTRLVGSMLVNLSAADPSTFCGAVLFLMSVALVATYVPARRATRVDPMVALRCE